VSGVVGKANFSFSELYTATQYEDQDGSTIENKGFKGVIIAIDCFKSFYGTTILSTKNNSVNTDSIFSNEKFNQRFSVFTNSQSDIHFLITPY
jgi:hypothetical protein